MLFSLPLYGTSQYRETRRLHDYIHEKQIVLLQY